jgi:lipopolysaccharide biosynthesis regulator YciM
MREARLAETRAQLAESLAAQRDVAERKSALDKKLEEQRQCCRRGIAPGRVDLDRLLTADRYELVLRAELQAVVAREESLSVEIAARQRAVATADGEVRALEKLRGRQLERFRQQEALVAVNELDEVAARGQRLGEPA